MKIGIVTVYDGLNYGSFLQAYAMKRFLEDKGHEVLFIRRFTEQENYKLFTTNKPTLECGFIRQIWRNLKKIAGKHKIKKEIQYVNKIFPAYQSAWKELDIINLNEVKSCDCIVCGSDEIWNLRNAYIDPEFYSCSNYGQNTHKVAVAISIGNTTYEEMIQQQTVVKSIKLFEAILARDERTQEVLSRLLGKEIESVCDPTLLIPKHYFMQDEAPIISKKYLLLYSYNLSDERKKIIKEYAKKRDLLIVSAGMQIDIADVITYESPLKFANLILNAECCFTSTFHGTIFAMLFARRFCSFPAFPKVEDVLKKCNAYNHAWNGVDKKIFFEIMDSDVCRDEIEKAISEIRSKSENLIDEVLKKVAVIL